MLYPHGRPQAWARGGTCPLWKYCNVFCAVIVTAKRLDELFIHYFHYQSSAWHLGLRPQTPMEIHPLTPLGDFRPQSAQIPNLPTPGKYPAGAHVPVALHTACSSMASVHHCRLATKNNTSDRFVLCAGHCYCRSVCLTPKQPIFSILSRRVPSATSSRYRMCPQ